MLTGLPFALRVHAVVRRIPRGRVASYSLVALVAGAPRAARAVGGVLARSHGLPWHRVLAQGGRISHGDPEARRKQAALLRREGVPVDARGRVDYARFEWRPRSRGASRAT